MQTWDREANNCAACELGNRPSRCDPGATNNGPAFWLNGSRCRRTAMRLLRMSTGGCVKRPPSFSDQPEQYGVSTLDPTGILMSWCGVTNQFVPFDFAKRLHCTATAPGRMCGSKQCRLRASASALHQGRSSKLRVPAPVVHVDSTSLAKRSHSVLESTSG